MQTEMIIYCLYVFFVQEVHADAQQSGALNPRSLPPISSLFIDMGMFPTNLFPNKAILACMC
jgi:hypothetical protein